MVANYIFALITQPLPAIGGPGSEGKGVQEQFLSDPHTQSQMVKVGAGSVRAFGLSIRKSAPTQHSSFTSEIDVLVSCHARTRDDARVLNVTAGCAAYSVLSSGSIAIGVPYDPTKLPDGVSESEIRVFNERQVAFAGPMAPIDSYLDIDNKQTIATLAQQSGRFINAVLRPGERSEKAPSNLSNETLKSFRHADPMRGVPIIQAPQANSTGDLRLTYPFDLPGTRGEFKPQLSVGYSAQSNGGNIAVGWHLSVPMITVETRWGVPIYDPQRETEVYLFNGDQLVPEAGDSFVDAQAEQEAVGTGNPSAEMDAIDRKLSSLNLVPQPHRTLHLRPRKSGKAHFVMRRDEGLWRFVRHGDDPTTYWWEAWQENPASNVARVMYFGRAPGRLSDDIERVHLARDMSEINRQRGILESDLDSSTLRLGPMAGLANPMAISKWGLTREKDSFGNIIDYDWAATCLTEGLQPCASSSGLPTSMLADRDLYLKRVVYTGHQHLEETILRCRERPDAVGCLHRQAVYELNLYWSSDVDLSSLPWRSDARSGGVVVSRRVLTHAEVRFRRRQPDGAAARPIHRADWECSSPFLAYQFITIADPLYRGHPGARRWLSGIAKYASRGAVVERLKDEDAFFPSGISKQACRDMLALQFANATRYETRFDYLEPATAGGNVTAFDRAAPNQIQLPRTNTDTGERIRVIRDAIPGVKNDQGPFAGSRIGAVETESSNAGLYVGFGGPIKGLSAGYKFTFSKRTSHKESTLFLDVDGDGIPDILSLESGRWVAHRGATDAAGNLSFGPPVNMDLPPGFRFQSEPVMEVKNEGPEAHAFGAMFGTSRGRSHTVQTVQLADMDGDGRVDVVTPGGVFYNATTEVDGQPRYQFTANSPFILNGTRGQPAVASTATPVPLPDESTFPSSHDHPRYDTVRTWRAPFRGLLRVTGPVRFIGADDNPDDVWGIAHSPLMPARGRDPLTDKSLRPAHRDGVIAAIERSSGNTVTACGAAALGSRVIDRLPSPKPGGPGEWTLIGTRVAPRDAQGGSQLDYRLSVSGRSALGSRGDPVSWESAITLRPAAHQRAIAIQPLETAIRAAVDAWNAAYSKDSTGRVVGRLSAERLEGREAIKLRFEGEMRDVPPLRLSLTVWAAIGVQLAGLQLDDAGDPTGSVDARHFKVDTRIVPTSFEPARNSDCAQHPDLAAAEALLTANGVEGGLILDVKQGDVLYFRVHSIDNGEDDVVTWAPQIAYLSAEDESPPQEDGTPSPAKKLIGPGLPQSPDSMIAELATTHGSLCLISERPAFCDANGRSLLRYRLTDNKGAGAAGDFAPFVLPNAGFTAPATGAVEIAGTIEKPETIGEVHLEYVVVPFEVLATARATHIDNVRVDDSKVNPLRSCDADVTRVGRSVTIAGRPQPVLLRGGRLKLQSSAASGAATTTMMAAPGTYAIIKGNWNDAATPAVCRTREGRRANQVHCAELGNEFDIREGDKVCLFVRSSFPLDPRDEDVTATRGFWPIDAAGFKVPTSDAIAVHYNTARVTEVKNLAPGSKVAPELSEPECINPTLGDRPKFAESGHSEPADEADVVRVCRAGDSMHYMLPIIQHGPMLMAKVAHVREPAPPNIVKLSPVRFESQRPTLFMSRVTAPAGVLLPAQECSWGPSQGQHSPKLYERRFMIELRGIAPLSSNGQKDLLEDPMMDPELFAKRLGPRVAKLRSRVLAFRNGQSRELPVKRFAIFASRPLATGIFRYDPAPLSPAVLGGTLQPLPGNRAVEFLYDASEPTANITQVLRFLRGVSGTVSLSSFFEQRRSTTGDLVSRTIQLPSTQAGFAVCATEDEEIVVESALDDRVADGAPVHLDQLERLLGRDTCDLLPLDAQGRLYPAESFTSSEPLSRSNRNICPLGTASIRLAALTGPRNFTFESLPLALAHKAIVSGRKPQAPEPSTRWRMPHEALTNRGVAVVAFRHRTDDSSSPTVDLRDPVNACAAQNLAFAVPPRPDDFGAWQRECRLTEPSVLPSEDPTRLATLLPHVEARNRIDAHNTSSSNPSDEEKKRKLHAPVIVLMPEERHPTADREERKQQIENGTAGPLQPAISRTVVEASLCNSPARPRVSVETSVATKVTWATQAVELQAAAGSQPGMQLHQCVIAPDPAIWATGDTLSSSRLGVKDIQFGSKLEAYMAASAYANKRHVTTPTRGAGISAPIRRSDTKSNASFNGAVAFGKSETTSRTESEQDVVDINGDGYPDTIVGKSVVLTDARGGNRCGPNSPWALTLFCKGQLNLTAGPIRKSLYENEGSSFGFPAAKKSAEVVVASGRAAFTGSMSGLMMPDKGQRTQESFFPWSLNVENGFGEGRRNKDIVDVNGDGLPDLVECSQPDDCSVSLNLGNRFDTARSLGHKLLMGDASRNLGLGLSIGWAYALNDNSFEGGLAGSANAGDITRTIVDVNGDGLGDILTIDPASAQITAFLNTGWGFTGAIALGQAAALKSGSFGRSETDNASAGGAYTYSYCWPVPPICIHINPNAAVGAAMTRQSIIFRDSDGDGLADFLVGDSLLQSITSVSLAFSRETATLVPNRLGQHGLLARIWHPSNTSQEPSAANLAFTYSRTGKTVKDPQHRWVMAQVTVRDGLSEDDAQDVSGNSRHTCFAYGEGAYDRFERQFLGYARVDIVEGCQPTERTTIEIAGNGWAQRENGLRRTERKYANGSVYDTGLMLAERVFDTSVIGLAAVPVRTVRQTYVLVDTALSTSARSLCHHVRSVEFTAEDESILALGFVRNIASANIARRGDIEEIGCRTTFPSVADTGSRVEPTFDTASRRLTPGLVQIVRETREIGSAPEAVLRNAAQFDLDHLARPRRACDLGEVIIAPGGMIETRGAVCSDMIYDDGVRPRFTHGATGGGTIQVEQRNRIKEVRISDFAGGEARKSITAAFDRHKDDLETEMRLLRRRSAAHHPQTAAVVKLCHFNDPTAAVDPCERYDSFPSLSRSIEQAARENVVMRAYHYDEFGNLARFVGPVGSGGTYVAKAYSFDRQLALVETAERTEHCRLGTAIAPHEQTICLSRNTSALGALRSFSNAIDYRHATPTLSVDVNGNATFQPLDELGRPTAVHVSWGTIGPLCGMSCSALVAPGTEGKVYRQIASYAYRVPDPALGAPIAIVTRHTDVALYSPLPNQALLAKSIHDHTGVVVQTFEEADVCTRPRGGDVQQDCGARHNYVASAIVRKDRLNRMASSAFPVSLFIAPDAGMQATRNGLLAQPLVATDAHRNVVTFDGLDRPLTVSLPDGNAYDFRYRIARSEVTTTEPMWRHRTDTRNALCVPSAVERDVRGTIRAVVESYNSVTVEGQSTAAVGSTGQGSLPGMNEGQPATGLVAAVGPARDAVQQVYSCNPARGRPFELATDRSVAAYDRDALGQLVAVRLPRRGPSDSEQIDAILVAYDPLGRRVLVDDPDRGFERVAMDAIGNPVCVYSGARRKALSDVDRLRLDYEEIRSGRCPDPSIPRREAVASDPDREITRLVRSEFVTDLPVRTRFKLFHQPKVETERASSREIVIAYGEENPENRKLNRVGRAWKTSDMVGDEERTFDPLGRATTTERAFTNLESYGGEKLSISDEYDIWGLHKKRTWQMKVLGKTVAGRPAPEPEIINESVSYSYTPAGQLVEIAGSSGIPGTTTTIASGMHYDVRGNLLGLNYGTGVTVRYAFDEASNRLVEQRARMGVAGTYIPQIYFQNLRYRYDAAGNVLAYQNRPIVAEPCAIVPPDGRCSDAIPAYAAKAHGLLIRGSNNAFEYDQLNRVRTATKSLMSLHLPKLDREGEPHLMDWSEISKAPKLTLDYVETFAFRPTHEMALLKRIETRGVEVAKQTKRGVPEQPTVEKTTMTFTSAYASDGRPRHAPGSIATRYKEAKLEEETRFGFDEFGRMSASLCTRSDKKGCWPDRYFDWNADDSLRSQLVQIPLERLPEAKKSGKSKGIYYYDQVFSEYDAAGRRTYKRLTERHIRKIKGKSKIVGEPFVSDTLYADAQLTISRREGQKPQAIVHYFVGPQRIASKWIGDERLFTYHAQLMTRSVTDIVVGRPGRFESARLNAQQEYAAFGQILHQRETLLAPNQDGVTSQANPGLPRYRFNAKEEDQSGLQDFGARYYDNRLALWLRPDPVLADYLNGRPNAGVYAPKNLASYGFGWGNPIGYIDEDGNAVNLIAGAVAVGVGAIIGGGVEATRQLIADGKISDLSRIGTAGLRAGITSGLALATGGASLFAGATIGATSNAGFGILERAYHGDEQTLTAVAFDSLSGGMGGAYGTWLSKTSTAAKSAPAIGLQDKAMSSHRYFLRMTADEVIDDMRANTTRFSEIPTKSATRVFDSAEYTATVYRSTSTKQPVLGIRFKSDIGLPGSEIKFDLSN